MGASTLVIYKQTRLQFGMRPTTPNRILFMVKSSQRSSRRKRKAKGSNVKFKSRKVTTISRAGHQRTCWSDRCRSVFSSYEGHHAAFSRKATSVHQLRSRSFLVTYHQPGDLSICLMVSYGCVLCQLGIWPKQVRSICSPFVHIV